MADFNPLIFIADHVGMNLADAIKEAYEQGKRDAQPKTGHWVEFPNHNAYVCSECGRMIETTDGKNNVYKHYPYCHCGARMEGEEHD